MISKNNLMESLQKAMANEDDFITSYGQDFKQSLAKCADLKDADRQEIEQLLDEILTDTQKHREIVGRLLQKIEKDTRNEY